ncbi:MAG: acyltransferase [Lysobacter sp.]|nr:acyltransferase [Lysobacter sp.]
MRSQPSAPASVEAAAPAALRLSDYAVGRDNNFNLVRFVAAFAVLWSHSFALSIEWEPWIDFIRYTPAGVAVDVFFVTSGFLVTASLLRLNNVRQFLRARALRIFPALFVMSALLTFVLGPWFTTLSLGDYFTESETWKFLVKNATVLFGLKFKLDGMFIDNPMDRVVNGSMWTLKFELYCYITLVLVWWLTTFSKSNAFKLFTRIVVVGTALMLVGFWWAHNTGNRHWHDFRLFYMFFCGAVFWIYRARVSMHPALFVGALAVLMIGIVKPDWFFWVYPPTVAYLVLWLAYVPGGFLRQFNRLGDYSYGVYIYAFPVQQALIASFPAMDPVFVFAWAALITVPLAMLSWHLVEKPMLARKAGGAKH